MPSRNRRRPLRGSRPRTRARRTRIEAQAAPGRACRARRRGPHRRKAGAACRRRSSPAASPFRPWDPGWIRPNRRTAPRSPRASGKTSAWPKGGDWSCAASSRPHRARPGSDAWHDGPRTEDRRLFAPPNARNRTGRSDTLAPYAPMRCAATPEHRGIVRRRRRSAHRSAPAICAAHRP